MPVSFIILNSSSTSTVFIPDIFIGNNKITSLPLLFGLANVTFKHDDTDLLPALPAVLLAGKRKQSLFNGCLQRQGSSKPISLWEQT